MQPRPSLNVVQAMASQCVLVAACCIHSCTWSCPLVIRFTHVNGRCEQGLCTLEKANRKTNNKGVDCQERQKRFLNILIHLFTGCFSSPSTWFLYPWNGEGLSVLQTKSLSDHLNFCNCPICTLIGSFSKQPHVLLCVQPAQSQ